MSEMAIPEHKKYPPTSHVTVHKDHVHDAKIGEPHTIHLHGKIKSISAHPDHEHMRNVEMEHEVDSAGTEVKEPLESMRKKMVEKHGESEYK
jgi:hypothetical protein